MGRKEPPDRPCECGGPLYEGHAMHTLACPRLTTPKVDLTTHCPRCGHTKWSSERGRHGSTGDNICSSCGFTGWGLTWYAADAKAVFKQLLDKLGVSSYHTYAREVLGEESHLTAEEVDAYMPRDSQWDPKPPG